MSARSMFRWLIFAMYISLFFVVPLTILWELPGLIVGLVLASSLLFLAGFQGADRITRRLQVKPPSVVHNPALFAIVREYCRRLDMPVPKVGVIETPALNSATFGFSRKSATLAITRGALSCLDRDALAALVARQLTCLWYGEFVGESWLSQFLAVVEKGFIAPSRPTHTTLAPRFYPFRLFLKQIVLYPLCLFPCMVLRGKVSALALDMKSLQVSQLPQGLAEGYRLFQARSERVPFHVPFSSRHLFLLPPSPRDPFARIFFGTVELGSRIKKVEKILRTVEAT